MRHERFVAALTAAFLWAAPGCNFSLDDYPYCFACKVDSDCPDFGDAGPATACGGDGFCHYLCGSDAECKSRNATCGPDGFCHALDGGGC